MFYQFYVLHFLNFTLVIHAVGRHLDSFSEGKPSLENRICLNKKSGISNTGYRYGRGGAEEWMCSVMLSWIGVGIIDVGDVVGLIQITRA